MLAMIGAGAVSTTYSEDAKADNSANVSALNNQKNDPAANHSFNTAAITEQANELHESMVANASQKVQHTNPLGTMRLGADHDNDGVTNAGVAQGGLLSQQISKDSDVIDSAVANVESLANDPAVTSFSNGGDITNSSSNANRASASIDSASNIIASQSSNLANFDNVPANVRSNSYDVKADQEATTAASAVTGADSVAVDADAKAAANLSSEASSIYAAKSAINSEYFAQNKDVSYLSSIAVIISGGANVAKVNGSLSLTYYSSSLAGKSSGTYNYGSKGINGTVFESSYDKGSGTLSYAYTDNTSYVKNSGYDDPTKYSTSFISAYESAVKVNSENDSAEIESLSSELVANNQLASNYMNAADLAINNASTAYSMFANAKSLANDASSTASSYAVAASNEGSDSVVAADNDANNASLEVSMASSVASAAASYSNEVSEYADEAKKDAENAVTAIVTDHNPYQATINPANLYARDTYEVHGENGDYDPSNPGKYKAVTTDGGETINDQNVWFFNDPKDHNAEGYWFRDPAQRIVEYGQNSTGTIQSGIESNGFAETFTNIWGNGINFTFDWRTHSLIISGTGTLNQNNHAQTEGGYHGWNGAYSGINMMWNPNNPNYNNVSDVNFRQAVVDINRIAGNGTKSDQGDYDIKLDSATQSKVDSLFENQTLSDGHGHMITYQDQFSDINIPKWRLQNSDGTIKYNPDGTVTVSDVDVSHYDGFQGNSKPYYITITGTIKSNNNDWKLKIAGPSDT